MDYEAIEKRNISYSKDVYFLHYDEVFELWLNGEKVSEFNNLNKVNAYLFNNYVNCRPARRVYVYTTYFNEVYNYYGEYGNIGFKELVKKNKEEVKSFRIFGGITYKDAKYYLGTDKTEKINPKNYCELISRFHSTIIKHSFTSSLKDLLLDEDLTDFGTKENVPYSVLTELYNNTSLAPIIYSDINKEFKNVYCYDFDSAYVSHYYKHNFPYKFTYVGREIKEGQDNFIRAKFINIKAKDIRFLPFCTAAKENGVGIVYINQNSKRFIMAQEITVSFFYDLEMWIIDKYYDYDEMIIEKVWTMEMRPLPLSFRKKVATLYKDKEQAKQCGEPYADKKVLLNRIHGFFLTKKDFQGVKEQVYPNLPAQIGFYTIALQRVLMCVIIDAIGLENVVSAHTDSIKAKGNFDDIINEYNEVCKLKEFDKLGLLEFEGIMEKVVYFSNTRAKYIMDGEFKIKHGGIDEFTAKEILKDYNYDTLENNSPYNHTLYREFISKEEGDSLNRISEMRMFSEGGIL